MQVADVIALVITICWCLLWVFAAMSGIPALIQVWEKGTFVMTFILGYYFKRGSESAVVKRPLKSLKDLFGKSDEG
jgi:hypothetical protein